MTISGSLSASLSATEPTWVAHRHNSLVRYEVMLFDGSPESSAVVTEWLRRTIAPELRITLDDSNYAEFRFHDDFMSTPVDRGDIIVRLNATPEASRVDYFSYGNTWDTIGAKYFDDFDFVIMDEAPEVTVDPDNDLVARYHSPEGVASRAHASATKEAYEKRDALDGGFNHAEQFFYERALDAVRTRLGEVTERDEVVISIVLGFDR
jgi:hypothetical protein